MKNPKEKGIMMKWRSLGVVLALACAPTWALAQGVIQSITSSQQAGSDVVASGVVLLLILAAYLYFRG